jgi:tetratricopeptide (TPR) repeat protein
MEIPDQFLEQVEAWEQVRLSPEETSEFEAAIAQGGKWYQLYLDYQEAQKAIDHFAEQEIKATWKKDFFDEEPEAKKRSIWPVMLAAAAGLLLLLSVFIFFPGKNSPEMLYAQFTEAIVLSPGQRGPTETDDSFMQANAFFNQKQYRDAISLLEQVLADTAFQRKDYALLHLGLCYLNLEQYDKASESLKQVDSQSTFRYDSMWYQALIAVKLGKSAEAEALLKQLVRESKTWKDKASKLLEAL